MSCELEYLSEAYVHEKSTRSESSRYVPRMPGVRLGPLEHFDRLLVSIGIWDAVCDKDGHDVHNMKFKTVAELQRPQDKWI